MINAKTLALTYRTFGSPLDALALERFRLLPLADGKLRVAMMMAPVNPSDLIPITGAYAHRIQLPKTAGYEGVGRVIAAPESHSHWIGERVLPLRGPGTWQSHVDCDPGLAVRVPDAIGDEVAARAYVNPLAVLQMLTRWPVAGRRVLLSGAGSECAGLLGYSARTRGAAEVVGIYRSASRTDRMRSLGIVPVSEKDERRILREAREADIVFDALGGPLATLILESMRSGALFVGYGLLTGRPVRYDAAVRARFERFHLRDAVRAMNEDAWQTAFSEVWAMVERVELPAPQFFGVEEWRTAVEHAVRPGGSKSMLLFGQEADG